MNTRKTLNESDLKQFENFDKLAEEYFILSLGIGLQYEYSPSGIKYWAPYEKMGQRLWIAFRYELYNSLCNAETKEPKEWLNDIVTGDIRNLATGIISAITARYDVSIAIALPVAALIVKNGLLNYCSIEPESPNETVSDILFSQKTIFNGAKEKKKSKKKKNK